MAIINTNGSFEPTDTVTNTNLNSVADAATFNDPVDETTLELITAGADSGKLRIKPSGVGTTQIAASSVTKAKIENVANMKVLGNTSGSAAAPQEVDVIDDDTMATALDTNLATAESIKAYADAAPKAQMKADGVSGASVGATTQSVTLPNGLIMKFGTVTAVRTGTEVSFANDFPTAAIWASACPNSSENLTQSTGYSGKASVHSLSTGSVYVNCDGSAYWQAIGY